MIFARVRQLLQRRDGSLPDINFDYGHERLVGDAYALVQGRASRLASSDAYYWSEVENKECPIRFGDNPALAVLCGESKGFHVVFGGLRSASGAPIPDLGVSVYGASFIGLDYRMGPDWDDAAIVGLFDLMRDLKALCASVEISHIDNMFESPEGILLTAFAQWLGD